MSKCSGHSVGTCPGSSDRSAASPSVNASSSTSADDAATSVGSSREESRPPVSTSRRARGGDPGPLRKFVNAAAQRNPAARRDQVGSGDGDGCGPDPTAEAARSGGEPDVAECVVRDDRGRIQLGVVQAGGQVRGAGAGDRQARGRSTRAGRRTRPGFPTEHRRPPGPVPPPPATPHTPRPAATRPYIRAREPLRLQTGQRVVVVPVPRAAQQPLFDRALPQRAALVRTPVLQRTQPSPAPRHRDAATVDDDAADPSLGRHIRLPGPGATAAHRSSPESP